MGEPPRGPGLTELLQIGAMCGISIGIGTFAGYFIDRVTGTSPLVTFLGLAAGILGAASGSYRVIRPFVSAPNGARTQPASTQPAAPRGAPDTSPPGAPDTKD